MRSHKLYEPYQGQRSETVAFAVLGIVAVVMVGLAVVTMVLPTRDPGTVLAGGGGIAPASGYVQSGQWRADSRTLAAIIRYVLQAEGEPVTQANGSLQDWPTWKELGTGVMTFAASGQLTDLGADNRTVMLSPEALGGYPGGLAIPVRVEDPQGLDGLRVGDRISFRLSITSTQSWIREVHKAGEV